MEGIRCGDGWWVLGIEGSLYLLSGLEEEDEIILGQSMNLGDLLQKVTTDSMVTATRNGLLRMWKGSTSSKFGKRKSLPSRRRGCTGKKLG